MKVKRKKTIVLYSVVALILIAATLITTFCIEFGGKGKARTMHRAFPLLPAQKSDEFLPEPDRIIYKSDRNHKLTKEDQEALYHAILGVCQTFDYVDIATTLLQDVYTQNLISKYGALEFRYDRKQSCTNAPKVWGGSKKYDAAWIIPAEGCPILVRVQNGKPQCYPFELCSGGMEDALAALTVYRETVKNVFANTDFDGPEWTQ